MNTENAIKFESPLDEALDATFSRFASPIYAVTVTATPEENEIFTELLRKDALSSLPLLTAEGKKLVREAEKSEFFAIGNTGNEGIFRVTEADEAGNGNFNSVYFKAESVSTGLVITVLNNPDETEILEVFPINYLEETEENDEEGFFFTRVYYRTAGLRPGVKYLSPRFFDLAYNGDEVLTKADLEERRRT